VAAAFRTEKDSLGEVMLPASAYYGAQTQRAANNFPISGLRPWRAFVWSMASIKRAAAEVNRDLGLLDPKLAEAIARAAQEVVDGQFDAEFVVDPFQAGAGTSHNMNANEVIANRANELLGGKKGEYKPVHPNDHVNMAQSTNDTIPPPSGSARCGGSTSCSARWIAWRARWTRRQRNSIRSSNRVARTFRTPCRFAWGRSSARTPGR